MGRGLFLGYLARPLSYGGGATALPTFWEVPTCIHVQLNFTWWLVIKLEVHARSILKLSVQCAVHWSLIDVVVRLVNRHGYGTVRSVIWCMSNYRWHATLKKTKWWMSIQVSPALDLFHTAANTHGERLWRVLAANTQSQ